MSASVASNPQMPWWKEPTKDQWYAYSASWLGWPLGAFDFTVFLFIIGPIADEFKVPVTEVTIVFTLTLWMRLLGATAAGWLGDRIGRRWPVADDDAAWRHAGFQPVNWAERGAGLPSASATRPAVASRGLRPACGPGRKASVC